jgi:hypothetical protein
MERPVVLLLVVVFMNNAYLGELLEICIFDFLPVFLILKNKIGVLGYRSGGPGSVPGTTKKK